MTEEKLIRKLGAAELVYDYEIKQNGCVLPFSVLVESKCDLLANVNLIDKAIEYMKRMHPFLCSKIAVFADEKHSRFSHNRFFAYASVDKIKSNENIEYMRLVDTNESHMYRRGEEYWKLLYEREFNIEPVNVNEQNLLWRFKLVELTRDATSSCYVYMFLFTVHHAIIDGRNAFSLLAQLAQLIEALISNRFDETRDVNVFSDVCSSIETQLFNDDKKIINTIRLNEMFNVPDTNKIPASFGRSSGHADNEQSSMSKLKGRFEYINANESIEKKAISVEELINQNQTYENTKFLGFTIEPNELTRFMSAAKRVGAKLTACLNLVCALATHRTYQKFDSPATLYYHILGNLRPFYNIGNLNMGYWSIVLNGITSIEKCKYLDDHMTTMSAKWRDEFWRLAKLDSDELHKRIDDGELIENAKLDEFLLNDIENNINYEHGAVHFAISNLGNMKMTETSSQTNDANQRLLNFKEFYFNTSCAPNRWTSVVFHGLTTLDGRLCWGITYNPVLVRKEIIQYLIEQIKQIINLAI